MNEDNIPRLIVGSLFHQLTAEEQQVLDDWLTADCEMNRFCAAAVILPASATSLKTR